MLQHEEARELAAHHPDPIDRASAEEAVRVEDVLYAHRVKQEARAARWPVRADGLCACGCEEEVEPKRLALGYGLAYECARAMDRK